MAVEEIRSRPALVHPPRTLNVQKFVESRASELESLHSVASNRLDNNFRSQRNKRRRTTSHDNRLTKKKSRKRRKIGLIDKVESAEENGNTRKVPRRIRRRLELSSNPERGFCTSGDGTKRLRTHLWHAKRFRMAKHWGFHLPEGLHGSGRGSRALLKWFKRGTVVHDASYYCPVQLEGPEDSLMSILRMVLVPTPSESTSILSGVCYGNSMLYHAGASIAPVTYMWRPVTRKHTESESSKVSSPAGFGITSNSACSSPFRQLWVWIHAAAFTEGHDALRDATQKQNSKEMGICVNCFPLDGHLSKLEVMGSEAIQVLQKILHAVSESLDTSFHLTKCIDTDSNTECQISKSYILEHAEHLPSGAILSMTVKDPRDLPKKGIEGVMDAHSGKIDAQENCLDGCATLGRSLDKNQEIISSLWSEAEADSVLLSDNEDMWRSQNSSSLPLEENLLCMEKHERRVAYFNMNGTNSRVSSSECMPQSSRSCPVLLLKENDQRNSYARWCIILPLSWVKAFWLPLVSSGARAIGFREKHQIACDVGLPSFPFGFPDSKAYSSFKAEEAAVSDKKLELRPPAMRPSRVPIPPPWSIIKFSVEGSIISEGGIQASCKKSSGTKINLGKSCANLDNNIHSSLQEQDESFFEGSIARTSDKLRSYMNEIHGDHLLLFPDAEMRLKALSEMLNSEGNVIQTPQLANPRPADWKPCFLRVHIRAYKEGVFEDGAVVCVPRLSDFSLWISRSDNQEGRLQIPESYIKSCYVQRPYGKSELITPEHSTERDSFRCPIGFVTAGFVRGSAKPVAEAFCEAYLLAELRREQWESMQEKQKKEQEILVLVRNPRSVSYRLALATIILEQKAEDIEFM
ncbi:ribonucleases P/MRP protein subunit POP1-like [Papaver somniferum]|uniref:ribonucleases P/MRP protein subunit POP1-like n=1 Tax=Papaver somniferum TaxID=3469 RepID=UPI000E6FF0A2|nr:ribonucleases P/MRP protein subunit POP1-like [Papaver somniferum]